jgi:hypothetical protein
MTALFQCLIVSQNDQRSIYFERAASDGGWEPIVERDAVSAAALAARVRFHFAIVDLEQRPRGAPPPGYCRLAEDLARQGGMLLVICGRDGDAMQEIWAHQLGAWLYLPGVDMSGDLAMLCSQARMVVGKLNLHPPPVVGAGSSVGGSVGHTRP